MATWVYLNDGFVLEEKALLSYRDLAFLRGYAVFDFFRLVGNEPLFLSEHLDRFYASASSLHLTVPFERPQLTELIAELIDRNREPNTGVRLSLTGGVSEDGFSPGKQPNFLLSQHRFSPPTKEQQQNGIRLLPHNHQRQLPQVKSIDYLMATWLQPKLRAAGADDLLYVWDGFVSESPRSNFFSVTEDDRIVTPADNCLRGITAKKLMEAAAGKFQIEQRAVSVQELQTAKEAFLTSTTKQLLPVRQIDDRIFSSTQTTQALLRLFREATVSNF